MHIVLLTSIYPPEIRSISTMMRELAEGLYARGHRVTVITPQSEDNLPDEEKKRRWPTIGREGPITVVRIKTFGQRTPNHLLRGLAELILPMLYKRAIRKWVTSEIDGVIVYTPHFPLTQVGTWVKRNYGARYLLNVQDIFPQNAIDAGIMRNKLIIRWFEHLERRAYAEADAITTHTSGGQKFLIEKKQVPPEKITTVYNWIDVDAFAFATLTPREKGRQSFRARHGLERKFVFLFAGILGPTQGLELVIEVARRLRDIAEIHFLFVGEGTEKKKLMRMSEEYGMRNVTFCPFVPPREYPALLAEMDVGLMCLAPENTTAVVPGKLFGYMAAGLPVLAFLQKQSEGHRIIQEANCGYSIVSDSIDRAEAFVRKMFQERSELKEYGDRGRQYAADHFSKNECIGQLEQLIGGGLTRVEDKV